MLFGFQQLWVCFMDGDGGWGRIMRKEAGRELIEVSFGILVGPMVNSVPCKGRRRTFHGDFSHRESWILLNIRFLLCFRNQFSNRLCSDGFRIGAVLL